MKAHHTPAPWVVSKKFRTPVIGFDVGDGGEPLPIVDVVHGYDAKQARANARLIAAAPELLETLRDLVDAYCRAGTSLSADERHEDRLRLIAARVAISNAAGDAS